MTPELMESRLKEGFPDADVMAIDLTGTSDHWEVRIASSAFKGMSRIQQHKAVMGLFEKELNSGQVHALSIKAIVK